jgi:hypothetical protein
LSRAIYIYISDVSWNRRLVHQDFIPVFDPSRLTRNCNRRSIVGGACTPSCNQSHKMATNVLGPHWNKSSVCRRFNVCTWWTREISAERRFLQINSMRLTGPMGNSWPIPLHLVRAAFYIYFFASRHSTHNLVKQMHIVFDVLISSCVDCRTVWQRIKNIKWNEKYKYKKLIYDTNEP